MTIWLADYLKKEDGLKPIKCNKLILYGVKDDSKNISELCKKWFTLTKRVTNKRHKICIHSNVSAFKKDSAYADLKSLYYQTSKGIIHNKPNFR
jgi:hypothetical protein